MKKGFLNKLKYSLNGTKLESSYYSQTDKKGDSSLWMSASLRVKLVLGHPNDNLTDHVIIGGKSYKSRDNIWEAYKGSKNSKTKKTDYWK